MSRDIFSKTTPNRQLTHSLYRLAEVLSITNSSLDRKPNLVLLMIGTNDINRNATVADTTTGFEKLVNLIWLRSGDDTLIIVSTIVPIGPGR